MSYPTSIAEGLSFCIEESGTSVKLGEIANATLASIANTLAFSILPSTLRATNPDITNLHVIYTDYFTHLEFLLVAAWDLGFWQGL